MWKVGSDCIFSETMAKLGRFLSLRRPGKNKKREWLGYQNGTNKVGVNYHLCWTPRLKQLNPYGGYFREVIPKLCSVWVAIISAAHQTQWDRRYFKQLFPSPPISSVSSIPPYISATLFRNLPPPKPSFIPEKWLRVIASESFPLRLYDFLFLLELRRFHCSR